MKTMIIGIVAVLIGLIFCPPLQALESKVRLIPNGKGSWPVAFEDAALQEMEKDAIFADYLEILSYLKPSGSYTIGEGANQVVMMKCDAFLGLSEWGGWPAAADEKIGYLMVDKDGKEIAIIPKTLSDVYRRALHTRKIHKAAYDELERFAARMTKMDAGCLPPIMGESVFFAGVPDHFAEELSNTPSERLAKEFGQCRYREGSLLDDVEWNGHPTAVLRRFRRGDGDEEGRFDEIHVIYEGGRWKFVLDGGMFE